MGLVAMATDFRYFFILLQYNIKALTPNICTKFHDQVLIIGCFTGKCDIFHIFHKKNMVGCHGNHLKWVSGNLPERQQAEIKTRHYYLSNDTKYIMSSLGCSQLLK